jgi:RNA polymerase sigma-70 factor (ECF subfamily)
VLVLRDVLGYRAGEVAEMLETSEASVNSLLRRARAAFESRLPAAGRERAPLPNSKLERDIVGRFAETVENGDIDGMVALLTDDAWLTMPPLPHAYQGPAAIGVFLRDREVRRGAQLRLVPTRANTQPAFGCYLPVPETGIARAYALFVLTLEGDQISAITWFADSSVFAGFGLPRMLR